MARLRVDLAAAGDVGAHASSWASGAILQLPLPTAVLVRAAAPQPVCMENQRAAVARKLSDPDFQSSLVNKSLGLVMGLSVALAAFAIHDAYIWANPPTPKYFIVDGEHAPRPVAALDSPIVDDAQLLDWTVKWALGALQRQLSRLSGRAEHGGPAFHAERLAHVRRKLHQVGQLRRDEAGR